MSTSIEWTDATWNPVRGCSRVSPGCVNCYAERMFARNLPGMRSPTTGKAFAQMGSHGPRWTGKVELIPSKLEDALRWRKPRRVFVNSMSDLFHEALPFEAIAEVYGAMAIALKHTFQVLTKRPQRRLAFHAWREANRETADRLSFNAALACEFPQWPLSNVWEGVSVEDQATADERIPLLLQTPAAVRFVSYEPALGRVDFATHLGLAPQHEDLRGELHWVIVGGESGPGARPFDVGWARSVVQQCGVAGVACFVKQLGSRPFSTQPESGFLRLFKDRFGQEPLSEWAPYPGSKRSSKGGDPSEWPADLRVREFPR